MLVNSFAKPPGLKVRREFLRVQRGGRRFKGRLMVLIVSGAEAGATARIGYTVSRKVGNAVIRNKVRRRMREVVRLHPQSLLVAHDHVFILFSDAASSRYDALAEEVVCLLSRARRRLSPISS